MKPIPIAAHNAEKIEAALRAVNGSASRHAYTSFNDIAAEAARAERKVLALLTKTQAAGARFLSTLRDTAPTAKLVLTVEQDAAAVARLRAGYVVR